MDRIVVVGPPGAGKTTVATAIGRRLGLPHVEMDSLWWEADWVEAGGPAFRARLAPIVAGESWVLDGNYFGAGARDLVWPRADTVVWLDLPRPVIVARVFRRSAVRGVRGTELWAGNRESLGRMVGADSIVRYAWREFPKYRRRYEALITDPAYGHLGWARLRSRTDVERWLAAIA